MQAGGSLLETDVITLQPSIPAGTFVMAGEADLSGCTILVVEDVERIIGWRCDAPCSP